MKLDVDGMKLMIAGPFSRLDEDDAEIELKLLGATVTAELSDDLDYLIAGDDAQQLCREAEVRDIPILTEHALLSIIGRTPKRRKEDLFPSGANLTYTLADDAPEETTPIALPSPVTAHVEGLELRARPTPFVTTRRFGETWGLKLSEFETHWLGTLWLGDAPMHADAESELAEHMYYYRFRRDGTDYANGERRFDGSHGFHASWLREAMRDEAMIASMKVVEDARPVLDTPVVWQRLDADTHWLLKLSTEHHFGHVHAYEHEEFHLDFKARTWRWCHYYTPYDATF